MNSYTHETKITQGPFSARFPTISEFMPLYMRREFFRRVFNSKSGFAAAHARAIAKFRPMFKRLADK